jgi:hypothetical protein
MEAGDAPAPITTRSKSIVFNCPPGLMENSGEEAGWGQFFK